MNSTGEGRHGPGAALRERPAGTSLRPSLRTGPAAQVNGRGGMRSVWRQPKQQTCRARRVGHARTRRARPLRHRVLDKRCNWENAYAREMPGSSVCPRDRPSPVARTSVPRGEDDDAGVAAAGESGRGRRGAGSAPAPVGRPAGERRLAGGGAVGRAGPGRRGAGATARRAGPGRARPPRGGVGRGNPGAGDGPRGGRRAGPRRRLHRAGRTPPGAAGPA